MNDYGFEERLREISNIREDYPDSYFLAVVALIVIIMIVLGFLGSENFFQSLYPNLISVVITVGILEVIQRNREKKKQSALNHTLNWNLGKNPNAPKTHRAFFEMIVYDALAGNPVFNFDISGFKCEGLKIKKTHFRECNMKDTEWSKIDFRRSAFEWVNLNRARFEYCLLDNTKITSSQLDGAVFLNVSARELECEMNMPNATLNNVDFRNSKFSKSSFENSELDNVILEGANLSGVNLKNVIFDNPRFSASTILPDGKFYDISRGVNQLKRFTDPNHPDFFSIRIPPYAVP